MKKIILLTVFTLFAGIQHASAQIATEEELLVLAESNYQSKSVQLMLSLRRENIVMSRLHKRSVLEEMEVEIENTRKQIKASDEHNPELMDKLIKQEVIKQRFDDRFVFTTTLSRLMHEKDLRAFSKTLK